jgi:predicted PhzF superfamily epimerase YddE/YHI9
MELPIFQVDAFTSKTFAGNPAAVCPLDHWLEAPVMQAIAAENNLAETAFFVKLGQGHYDLRWFTPTVEVKLCGHATLATSWVIRNYLGDKTDPLRFESLSGPLLVSVQGEKLCLDFPALPAQRCQPHPRLIDGLGTQPLEILSAMYYLAVFASEADVCSLNPDFGVLKQVDKPVIATAPGNGVDFVSRFFAPAMGIDEDPVCGSAHCTSTPYWSRRLGKKQLAARQVSARGGEIWCEDRGERILIAGHVAPYLKGTISI